MLRGGFTITCQYHSAQPFTSQVLQNLTRLRPDIIPTNDSPQQITFREPNFGKSGLGWGNDGDRPTMLGLALGEPLTAAERADRAIPAGTQTLPGYGFEAVA